MARTRNSKSAPAPATDRPKLEKIGALWLKTGAKGKFLSGVIELDDNNTINVLVFPNGYKEASKHPDYVIYESPAPDNPNRGAGKAPKKEEITDDEIPF